MKSIKKILYLIIVTILMSVGTFQNSSVARELRGYLGDYKENGICQNNYNIDFSPHDNDYNYDYRNFSCQQFAITSAIALLPGAITTDIICTNAKNAAKDIKNLSKFKKFRKVLKGTKSTAIGGLGYSLLDPVIFSYIEAGIQGASCPMAIAKIGLPAATGCCISAGATAAMIIGTPYIYLTLPYYAAQDSFDNVRVCGYDWYSYQEGANPYDYPEYGIYPGSYSYKVRECLTNSNCVGLTSGEDDLNKNLSEWDIGNKIFREYVYQGKEFSDDECKDPRVSELKGFYGDNQRYYLKGLERGNYACYRRFGKHLSEKYSTICGINVSEPICKERMEEAYSCCIRKNRRSICLERTDKNVFLESSFISLLKDTPTNVFCYENDEDCYLSGNKTVPYSSSNKVRYNVYAHPSKSNMLCARTNNLCPYNHNVAGGMEEKVDYDCSLEDGMGADCGMVRTVQNVNTLVPTSSYGKAKNYCQLYANCTYVGQEDIPRKPTLVSRVFSSACQNLKGDSLNYAYREREEEIESGVDNIWERFIFSRDSETIRFAGALVDEVRNQGLNIRDNDDLDDIMSIAITVGGTEFASDLSRFISQEVTDEIYVDNRATVDEFLEFRGISTPIVQCIKETLENIFFNLEGYTKCIEGAEMNRYGNCKCLSGREADADGLCVEASGSYDPYIYKKGRESKDESPFSFIQKRVRGFVRLIMVFSLIFVGFKILTGGVDIRKFDLKKISLYLTKFGLIWYFALGLAWQQHFASAVLNASQEVSSMITKAYYPLQGVCPAQTTRDINDNCVCDNDRIWNNSSGICECPEYSVWDSASGSCQPTILNMVWDSTNNRFICNVGMGLSGVNNQCVCIGNAILQGGSCVCPTDASIDQASGNCVCDIVGGYEWSSASGSCVNDGSGSGNVPLLPSNTFINISPNSNIAPDTSDYSIVDLDSPLYDGCFFDPDDYPAGKGYLATFDAFDCKIARYIGYGPEVSVPGILVLIIPGLFTARLGVLFVVLSLSFAILIILITIRVVTTFLLSLFAIILLIYVSPIIIPLALFEKTKNIFTAWLSNLIGFIIQPIMLFAYIAVFLNVTEPILLGSAYFEGDMKGGRRLVCQQRIVSPSATESFFEEEIYDVRAIRNPKVDSLLCLFGDHSGSAFGSMAQSSGATGIGVGVSVIKDAASSGEGFFMRLLTIFKGVLLAYLFYTFIDQIPKISSYISGSTALEPTAPGLKKTMKRTFGMIGLGRKVGRDAVAGQAGRVKRGFVGTAKAGEAARKRFSKTEFSTSLGAGGGKGVEGDKGDKGGGVVV
jgi:hypothetical protein